jgi:hypothetical protein
MGHTQEVFRTLSAGTPYAVLSSPFAHLLILHHKEVVPVGYNQNLPIETFRHQSESEHEVTGLRKNANGRSDRYVIFAAA